MRTLNDHKVGGANEELRIAVADESGAGGANHRYEIYGFDSGQNPSRNDGEFAERELVILFQNGPLKENAPNGITQEALLAIVIDRLRSFQAGPYACRENAIALTHCEDALMWLQKRTRDRMARGVEGKSEK